MKLKSLEELQQIASDFIIQKNIPVDKEGIVQVVIASALTQGYLLGVTEISKQMEDTMKTVKNSTELPEQTIQETSQFPLDQFRSRLP